MTGADQCFDPLARELHDQPILSGRHPANLYLGMLAARARLATHSGCCYDPAFQAGYPRTPIFAKRSIRAVSEGTVGQNCSTKFRMLKNSGDVLRSAGVSGLMMRSVPSRHETIEECRELLIAIERKNVRDVLVWPHDHHAPSFAINATHGEDVVAAF